MGLSISLFMLMHFLALLSLYNLMFASSSFVQPLCHDDESFALLQFKESFIIDHSASSETSAYPKVSSWKLESDDCCSWDGVGCDKDTGHVISLDLSSSCLYGSINSSSSLFRLVNLQRLNLSDNYFNLSRIPVGIRQLSPLKLLKLAGTSFYGELPDSIGDLKLLNDFDVRECNFSGPVPSSFGNLTELIYLDLGQNWKLTPIPFFIRNLTQLTYLNLGYCNLTGHIPSWLANLTQLADLRLGSNGLHGPIPSWISRLTNLQNLSNLQLSSNQISLLTKPSNNTTFPKFRILGLGSCDLHEFPDFLKSQEELEFLVLSNNKISGLIPKWMWNSGKKTLWNLALYNNFLTGFHQFPVILPWTNLRNLDLSYNKLQGSLPIPSPSIITYSVSNNTLTGELPQMICNPSSLVSLDLSYNNLSGMLPDCLGNLSFSLSILNLRRNNFHGNIPQLCKKGSKLKMIDFSQNQLQGWIARSLVNCTLLETLCSQKQSDK
ncbi:hypothetical protein ACB092_04G126600 [Castanea dentata]